MVTKELRKMRKDLHQCPHCGDPMPEGWTKEACPPCHKVGVLASTSWRWKLSRQIFDHYGWRCYCCGERHPFFLTLDHVEGKGNIHRKEVRKMGSNDWYKWVIENDFPEGFRTACYSCNLGAARNKGVCPHKEEEI